MTSVRDDELAGDATRARLGAIATGLAIYALGGGVVSLAGWVLDQEALTDWYGNGISIQPNTTIAVIACATAVLALRHGSLRLARLGGLLAAALGACALFEWITAIDLGIDHLLLFDRTWGRGGVVVPGRMGPPGASSWALLGTAIVLATRRPRSGARAVAPALALLTTFISSLSLVGYLYGANLLFTVPTLSVIALQTATFIVAVSIALILSIPERGPTRLLSASTPAGILARRTVPALILVPVVIGFLRLQGERAGFYDTAFGSSLRTMTEIVLLLGLFLWTGFALDRHARRRRAADDELRTTQSRLETELADSQLLQRVSSELMGEEESPAYFERLLDAAMAIMRSDFASLQMVQPEPGHGRALRLLAHRGFTPEAAAQWEWVREDSGSSCAKAFASGTRTVIADIEQAAATVGEAAIDSYRLAGIRAMQSTPLTTREGELIGMMSTHWSAPHAPAERELRSFDILVRQAADLVERKGSQAALRERERLLHSVTEHALVGLVIVDAQHRYRYANPSYAKVLGLETTGLVGRHVSDVLGAAYHEQVEPQLRRAFAGERVEYELSLPAAGDFGRRRFFAVSDEPQFDDDGTVTSVVVALVDVSQRKELEQVRDAALERESAARAEAERAMQMKDEFLATLSHELRTPLNAVIGWTQLLKADIDDPEKVRNAVAVIERNGWLQAQLITDLLDMSRIITGKLRLELQRVDLVRVVEAAIASVAPAVQSKSIRIRFAHEPTGELDGDPARLQQIVWNLLSNAVKFTPQGGAVSVALERDGSHAELRVVDTGDGISADFLPHIFQRFRQADASAARSQGGLGIGLALVKQLVELHGGTVRASSDGPGRGATFVVRLPIAAARGADGAGDGRAAAALAGGAALRQDLRGVRVLLVDDEVDALTVVHRLLDDCGARVVPATSSSDALQLLARERFDVIVSDIGLPRLDGYGLISEARALGIRTPALAFTAFAHEEHRVKALAHGYQAHVAKPIAGPELLAAIAALLERQSRSATAGGSIA